MKSFLSLIIVVVSANSFAQSGKPMSGGSTNEAKLERWSKAVGLSIPHSLYTNPKTSERDETAIGLILKGVEVYAEKKNSALDKDHAIAATLAEALQSVTVSSTERAISGNKRTYY